MRWIDLALLAALTCPSVAQAAEDWKSYDYSDAGFTVYFPAPPTVVQSAYRTLSGQTAPSTTYSAEQDNVHFAVTVADFSKSPISEQTAMDDAVKAVGQTGQVKVDVEARIRGEYGRELSVQGKDGSRAVLAIFFVSNRLYVLDGRALPPNADNQSGLLIRFQQSLQFTR